MNNSYTKIQGARWWKFDFHNHTPASDDFGKGDLTHFNISPRDWLLMYMRAEIDCVAITDHNTGKWIDLLKVALEELKIEQPEDYKPLYLFPGVEITAPNNVHILAIFDQNSDSACVSALLGAIGFPPASFGKSNAVSRDSIEQIINTIHLRNGIAIPAHVDKPCGLFTKCTGHTLTQALHLEGLLAIEVIDSGYQQPDLYKQSKLNLTEVIGSDSHIAAQVGSNFTWIKMSEPTLSALKLALHDGVDGVIRKENAVENPNTINTKYYIKSLTVRNGFKAGNGCDLVINFSPWLTSIIGGRGAGKSAILNYLRIGLSKGDEMPFEIQAEFDKFNKIGQKGINGMLREETEILIEIVKDGTAYKLRWFKGVHTYTFFDTDSHSWEAEAPISNIKDVFPIQIFSQKELYSLTGTPSKLLELIDSQFDKPKWIEERSDLVDTWLRDRSTLRHLNSSIANKDSLQAQLRIVNNRIQVYESSEFKDTLSTFNKLSQVHKFYEDTYADVTKFASEVDKLKQIIPQIDTPDEVSDMIVDDSLAAVEEVKEMVFQAAIKIDEAQAILKNHLDLQTKSRTLSWHGAYESSKAAYEQIQEQITESTEDSYESLLTKRDRLKDTLESIRAKEDEMHVLTRGLNRTFLLINGKEQELRAKRKEVISRWAALGDKDNPYLLLQLHPLSDGQLANTSFRKLLRKDGKEYQTYIYNEESDGRYSGIVGDIIMEPEVTRWKKRHCAILRFIRATEGKPLKLDLRLAKHLDSLRLNTPEDIDRLLIWYPEDKLILKFKKDDKEEDIQSGSAGERTAGMLGLLLGLNDIPLFVDQPEDDLDTRLISTFVVPAFKDLKYNRQLSIVTHNPNITVNANSEMIVYMNFLQGQLVVSRNDALQDKEIREAVCEVMEGGRHALDRRYYRISKALSHGD
jgi:hypothetical protein